MPLLTRFRSLPRTWPWLVILLLFMGTRPGSGAPLVQGLEASREAYRRGDYREAADIARRVAGGLAPAEARQRADALEQFAEASWAAGRSLTPATMDAARECLALRQQENPPSGERLSRAHLVIARIHRTLAHFPEARAELDSALASVGPDRRGTVLLQCAALEMNTGHFPAADSIFDLAGAALAGPTSDPTDRLRLEGLRGQFLQLTGQYVQAESVLTSALHHMQSTLGPQHPETAGPMQGLGNVCLAMGRYDDARGWFERALALRRSRLGEDHPDVALSINGLGVVARRLEHYDEALRAYTQASAIARKTLGPSHPNTIQYDNNLAGVYYSLGFYEEAFPVVERGLAARIQIYGKDHPDVAQSYQNLGTLKEKRRDLDGAAADLQESRRIFSRTLGPDADQALYVSNLLAMVEYERGRLARADSLEGEVVTRAAARPGPENPELGYWIADLAVIERDLHRPEDALATYERALTIVERHFGADHPQTAQIIFEMAIVNAELGRMDVAMDDAIRAETIGRGRLSLMAEALPERMALEYAGERPGGLPLAVSLLSVDASPDSIARVWDQLVRSRALIQDEVSARGRQMASPADTSVKELAGRHAAALSQYAAALVKQSAEDNTQVDSLRAVVEKLEVDLMAQSSEFRRKQTRRRAGFEDVRNALPDGSALVALYRYDRLFPDRWDAPGHLASASEYAAFVLRAGSGHAQFLRLGRAASLDSLAQVWRNGAGRPPTKTDGASLLRAGRELAQRLWTPVAGACGGATSVYWVLDGDIALLNPYAWIGEDGRYLVESGPAMHLLDAERDLIQDEARPKGTGLLALGDPDFDRSSRDRIETGAVYRGQSPDCEDFARHKWERLPGSAAEITDIAGLCRTHLGGERVDIMSGANATETRFKTQAPGRRMIHLATHGFYLEDQCAPPTSGERGMGGLVAESSGRSVSNATAAVPLLKRTLSPTLRSGLILAGANLHENAPQSGDDGVLTAEEIGALDLSTVEWAVISACATGVGTVQPGEGILGLRRAFVTAGARTLITSLWPVEDRATQAWMDALYRARVEDRASTIEAVRKASLSQLEARRAQHASTHPFYWAAFVAHGDWR